jgi:hypothetical protein
VTTIGMLLTVGGALTALLALRRLRVGCCPGCGAAGSLRLEGMVREEFPWGHPTLVRTQCCDECGATVHDRRSAARPARIRHVTALSHHLAR